MKKIILLNDHIINMIAAGEIIEHPSCICRELIDNSIDALSKKIIIKTYNGGMSCIKIMDDGVGMSYEDAIISIKKHTTSKIKNINDLNNIKTLGFRGEALASICSIATIEIITKTSKEELGTKIIFENGQLKTNKIVCESGTTVTITNIFKNIPVRKINFRKKNIENLYIYNIIKLNAISHPNISFQFFKEDKHVFTTNGKNKLLNNIDMFFGSNFVNNLLKVSNSIKDYSINGYILNPKDVNKNKNIQCIFVNNRIVKSDLISKAVKSSFEKIILNNENPSYILFLTVTHNKLNINIHPKKNQVLFLEKEKIFYFVKCSCQKVLSNIKIANGNLTLKTMDILIKNINNTIIEEKSCINNLKILGKCFNTYLIVLYYEQLILIDKHAAHEKIIYNKLINQFQEKNFNIELKKSYRLEMDFININFVMNNIIFYKKVGFEIDFFDEKNILIRKIPIFINEIDIEYSIYNILYILKKENFIYEYDYKKFIKKFAAKISCQNAIRSNYNYNNINIENMIEKIINDKSLHYCPHGRPIIMILNKKDIDKYFKRV